MGWQKLPDGSEICVGDRAMYEAAIKAAPPGTFIKMGDLEPVDMVTCTTCGAKMERKASEFHKHPKDCPHCGDTFDENLERHTPVIEDKHIGAGTMTTTTGCKKEKL